MNPADIQLSYRLIVVLSSGYQGSHVASEILVSLNHPSKPQRVLDFATKMIAKITTWVDALLQRGEPVLRAEWTSPKSEDARLAWQMIDSLKLELNEVKELSQMILTVGPEELSEAELGWCVAQYGRHLYANRDQLLLNMAYGQLSDDRVLVAGAQAALETLAPQFNELDSFVDMILQGGETLQLRMRIIEKLRNSLRLTCLQLHDLNTLYHCFQSELTYSMFGFSEAEAAAWKDVGFYPEAASLWRASGHSSPLEAVEWVRGGWNHPASCSHWVDLRFAPAEALEWKGLGIEPEMAREWRRAGFGADKARVYIEKGMRRPPGRKRD